MSVLEELGLPELPEALPRPMVDNHTHLFSTEEYSGLRVADALDLAASVGVGRVVEVGTDVASSRQAAELAQRDPRVVAAVAIHPNDAARLAERDGTAGLDAAIGEIHEIARQAGVRAIGETGLDYYRTRSGDGKAAQAHSFRAHIELASELDLTLVIHDRDAHDDILAVLDDVPRRPERVVMHCFSGDADFARRCAERGYWLSFPGVVTFGSAEALREAALATPLDRILVETDAPYLTPKPCRGKANSPYLMPHTVRFLAELLGVGLEEFCDAVVANTDAAYGRSWGSDA